MRMPSAPSSCSSIASRAKSDRWSRRLGGIDGLVFTAGIGENDVATRAEVIAGLAWAGLTLDEAANRTGGPRISSGSGPTAWVIPTNEELVIARQTRSVLGATQARLAS